MWGSLKSIITSAPQPAQPVALPQARRTKRTNDPQDAKALPKTQRTALGDISNRNDGVQQPSKRTTRATHASKPLAGAEAPIVIPAPPVPKMTAVYPTGAPTLQTAPVVSVVPPLVAEAKGATIPQASPDPMAIDIIDHAQQAAASTAAPASAIVTSPMIASAAPLIVDIDKDSVDDPLQCTEYVNDIYAYLREMEVRYRPTKMYLENNRDMTPRMRAILVDWLVELAEEYNLNNETLHLTVCYLDRFLSIHTVPRTELQLVGISCCLIASKFEEVHPPVIDDFLFISENAFTREQIVACESRILNALQFNLAMATIRTFLRRFLKAANANQRTCFLAGYIAELALLEYSCIKFLPSMIATCAICLALHSQGLEGWSDTFEHYTQYQLTNPLFQECLRTLQALYRGAEKSCFQAIRSKHSHSAYMKVAMLRPVQ